MKIIKEKNPFFLLLQLIFDTCQVRKKESRMVMGRLDLSLSGLQLNFYWWS